ncbi:MAG: sigma-70 family RNA polymerase sigma factor [Gemmatimonadota bacterium]|nr:sigma-70 family RNA polymerase sigma factor [Gemmatimonadota bacterium]
MDVRVAFEEHYASLFRYALRFTGDPDAAEDIAQEAFVRLLEQDLPADEVRPWLFVVAANLARDGTRRTARRRRLLEEHAPLPSRPEAPERRVERGERIGRVREALAALSERDRTLLLMREEGFRYSEIAAAVGVKPTSVGALVARALKRFRKELDAWSGWHDPQD